MIAEDRMRLENIQSENMYRVFHHNRVWDISNPARDNLWMVTFDRLHDHLHVFVAGRVSDSINMCKALDNKRVCVSSRAKQSVLRSLS